MIAADQDIIISDFGIHGFGDGSDGDVTISSPTTLTRDMYYNNLTVNDTLTTDGYRIFVKETISGSGTITWGTPNNGANATNSTGARGGAQSGSGPLKNTAGSDGCDGSIHGSTIDTPNDVGNIYGFDTASNGVQGGRGGKTTSSGADRVGSVGGLGGVVTYVSKYAKDFFNLLWCLDLNKTTLALVIRRAMSGGGGGGGGVETGGQGAGGGGGGASGGTVFICAKTWSGTFTIVCVGGNGGNGANGTYSGGTQYAGGGASAGNGGIVIRVFRTDNWSGSCTLTGGTKGVHGTTNETGSTDGSDGVVGTEIEIDIMNIIY